MSNEEGDVPGKVEAWQNTGVRLEITLDFVAVQGLLEETARLLRKLSGDRMEEPAKALDALAASFSRTLPDGTPLAQLVFLHGNVVGEEASDG